MNKKTLPSSLKGLRVGLFPYGTTGNPYQRMIAEALTLAGFAPQAVPKKNWFALRQAVAQPVDVLQMYWPHSLFQGASPLASALKRLMYLEGLRALEQKPFVYSVENLYPHDSPDTARDIRMIQRLLDRVDACVVMARASEEIFRQTYRLPAGMECHLVPHRNYLDIYPHGVSREEARRRLELPPTTPVVLFLGRLLWYKGLDRLLPAFLQLNAPEATLVLAGKPSEADFVPALEQRLATHRQPHSGKVRMDAKFVPDDEIQCYMNAADIVVLPYADMPINPGSLILAMGFGKAIVSPAKGATPEIAGPSVLFGYDENQPNGLADALQRALGANDLAARGREAADRARTNHSKERVAAAFDGLYTRLADRLRG